MLLLSLFQAIIVRGKIGDVVRAGSFVGIKVIQEFCNTWGRNGDGVNFGARWGGGGGGEVEGMGLTRLW